MKMIYKALFSIIILVWFYSNCFSQASLSIGSVNGTPGNSISVPVHATGIIDMTGFQFTITYDKTKLSFVNCTNWVSGLNASQVQINQLDGKLTFVYTDAPINIADGRFLDLNFAIINGSSGNAAISWSDSPTQRELSNSIPNEISCLYTDGGVTISSASLLAPVAAAAIDITQTGFSAAWNSSAMATGYRLDVALDNGFTNYITGYQSKDVGNVTTLPITGLLSGTTYYYRVKAYNTGGTSGASNTINVTTLSSQNGATLTIGNGTGISGNTVSIPVSATNLSDVVGFQFTIVYDKTKLSFVNCTNWVSGLNASQVQINQLDGKLTFVYTDAPINIANGRFFDLNFTIIDISSGNAAISWSDIPTRRELSNSIPNEISCTYSDGAISISLCNTPGTPVSVSGNATSHTTANLSWSVGSPVGSPTITYYWVVGTNSSVTYGNGIDQGTTTGTSASTSALSAGTTYYLRVYAQTSCDGSSSGYRTSASFTTDVSSTTPTTQASNITFSIVGTSSMTANWTNGNGSRRVVKVNTSNSFTAPSNGTDPSANTNYGGSGEQVVYNGSGNSVTVTGLSAGTTYWVRVYEANCSGSSSLYYSATASGNPNSQSITSSTCTAPYNGMISPANPTVEDGNGVNLTVTANGTAPFTYQWYWWNGSEWIALTDSSPYSGATTQTLTINPTTTSMDGYTYTCLVFNSCGNQNNIGYVQLEVTSCGNAPLAPAFCIASIGDPANGLEHWTNLSCDEVSNADGYSYEYSWDGVNWAINWHQSKYHYITVNHYDNPNVPVYYRVRAYRCTPLQYSSYTYASPQPIYTACDIPAALTINKATNSSLNITLNPETPIENPWYTKYCIYYFTEPDAGYVQADGTLGDNPVYKTKGSWGTITVKGLSNTEEYCFYAFAVNNDDYIVYNEGNPDCATLTDITGSRFFHVNGSIDFKIFPNPVTNELTIELVGNKNKADFEIINSFGQAIFTGEVWKSTVIQMKNFMPGIYLIKLKSGKEFEFKKIIKI